jgi:Tetratricopeptide repeat
MLLIERGRSEEALASLPAEVQEPLLFVVRALAQLELGRFDDARKSIDTLSAPFVFEGLTEYLKHRVRLLQVSLALATQDVATLSLALTWLEPTDEPLLRASVLSTLGRGAEAVAFLREQPETAWMSRIELAQREGRWADALALIEPHERNTPSDRAFELSLRRAYTDVMLKQPEACARLEALRATGKHRFALFPDERKRLDAAVKPHCR